jgi:hypothetical protein
MTNRFLERSAGSGQWASNRGHDRITHTDWREPTSGLEPLTCSLRVSCSNRTSNPVHTCLDLGSSTGLFPRSRSALSVYIKVGTICIHVLSILTAGCGDVDPRSTPGICEQSSDLLNETVCTYHAWGSITLKPAVRGRGGPQFAPSGPPCHLVHAHRIAAGPFYLTAATVSRGTAGANGVQPSKLRRLSAGVCALNAPSKVPTRPAGYRHPERHGT